MIFYNFKCKNIVVFLTILKKAIFLSERLLLRYSTEPFSFKLKTGFSMVLPPRFHIYFLKLFPNVKAFLKITTYSLPKCYTLSIKYTSTPWYQYLIVV